MILLSRNTLRQITGSLREVVGYALQPKCRHHACITPLTGFEVGRYETVCHTGTSLDG